MTARSADQDERTNGIESVSAAPIANIGTDEATNKYSADDAAFVSTLTARMLALQTVLPLSALRQMLMGPQMVLFQTAPSRMLALQMQPSWQSPSQT
jgi:hypothetical protein